MIKDYSGMELGKLHKLYKEKCREFKELNDDIATIRAVLFSKQDIVAAEKKLDAARSKHASNTGKVF